MGAKIIIEITTEKGTKRLKVEHKIIGENGNPYELTLAKDIYKHVIGLVEKVNEMLKKYNK